MLSNTVIGTQVLGFKSLDSRILEFPENIGPLDTEKKSQLLELYFREPSSIIDVDRIGKYIIIILSSGVSILTHYKFNGWIIPNWVGVYQPRRFLHSVDPYKFSKFILRTNQGNLIWVDSRVLSRVHFFSTSELLYNSQYVKDIGPDADTPEAQKRLFETLLGAEVEYLTSNKFQVRLKKGTKRSNKRIRDFLLDQKVVSGIGNYLVCEVLYRSKLHGSERVKDLTLEKVIQIIKAIYTCVKLAENEPNKDWWEVFQRKKTKEGYPVTRESWGKRGHYVCYHHQPIPRQLH